MTDLGKKMCSGLVATIIILAGLIGLAPKSHELVATRTLPAGTILQESDVEVRSAMRILFSGRWLGSVELAAKDVLGSALRKQINAGNSIERQAISHPGEAGFLLVAMSPRMRAISLSVCSQFSNGVVAGERIDIALALEVRSENAEPLISSEKIQAQLRVLAVEQSPSESFNRSCPRRERILVEASARVAEKLAIAQVIGEIVALRGN